jgi:hypothetical protein
VYYNNFNILYFEVGMKIIVLLFLIFPLIVNSQEFWDEPLEPVGAHNISMISKDDDDLVA